MIDPRPPDDLRDKLHHLQILLGECRRHERLEDTKYEAVSVGLMDADRGLTDALEGWPA